jgi:hypothetical protein
MPMQRITRYNLFLQNLYEKSKNAKDKERIYSCLSRVAGVLLLLLIFLVLLNDYLYKFINY